MAGMKFITSLFLATAIFAHAEVKVTLGEVSDRRTTGQFMQGLEIQLKLSGPELAECKGVRVVVKDAKDNAGKDVPVEKDPFTNGGFAALEKAFGSFGNNKGDEFEVKLKLKNPARAAESLAINGAVEFLMPSKDPASTLTVDVAKEAGKPLANEALKAGGVTITLNAPKADEMTYKIADPNKKVSSVEFCSADGKALETNGWSSSGFGGAKDVTIRLRDKAPAGVVAKVYVLTEKSVVSVPLKLEKLVLP
jgi:hypothetical protein